MSETPPVSRGHDQSNPPDMTLQQEQTEHLLPNRSVSDVQEPSPQPDNLSVDSVEQIAPVLERPTVTAAPANMPQSAPAPVVQDGDGRLNVKSKSRTKAAPSKNASKDGDAPAPSATVEPMRSDIPGKDTQSQAGNHASPMGIDDIENAILALKSDTTLSSDETEARLSVLENSLEAIVEQRLKAAEEYKALLNQDTSTPEARWQRVLELNRRIGGDDDPIQLQQPLGSREQVVRLQNRIDGLDQQAAAKAAERTKKLREETAEAVDDTMLGRRLKAKLDEYAARKADVETRGGDPSKPWHTGRRKREEALKGAEEALFSAQNEYTTALIAARENAGLYEGENDQLEQAKSDDFFDEFRKLDSDARKATLSTRLDRIKNRNIVQKGLAAVGKFLNGGKGKGWLRNMGPGAAVGLGIGLSGAAWPITTIAGAGLSLGVRYASKTNMLDKSLDDYKEQTMTDEELATARRSMVASGADRDAQAKELAQTFFEKSRTEGDKALGVARQKAMKNAMKFGAGFAIGGAAGHLASGSLFGHEAAATNNSPTPPHNTPPAVGPENHVTTAPSAPLATPDTFHFPAGAAHISSGEGWYHQFADMGLSSDQAQSLFADHNLMNKLVSQGVAYVDNSSQIGGFGIKLPVGGNLSPQAMETIKQAMIAKGYIN